MWLVLLNMPPKYWCHWICKRHIAQSILNSLQWMCPEFVGGVSTTTLWNSNMTILAIHLWLQCEIYLLGSTPDNSSHRVYRVVSSFIKLLGPVGEWTPVVIQGMSGTHPPISASPQIQMFLTWRCYDLPPWYDSGDRPSSIKQRGGWS